MRQYLHIGSCDCTDCAPEASLRWALDATLPLLVEKAEFEDPFKTDELALAATLSLAFNVASDDAYAMLMGAMQPPVDLRVLDETLNKSSERMRELITVAVAAEVLEILQTAARNGALDATVNAAPARRVQDRPSGPPPPVFAGAPMASRVVDSTLESVKHYAQKYFDTVLRPGIQSRITTVLENTPVTDVPSAAALQSAVTKAFKAQGYWKTVANAAVSRVYHYAFLKTAQLSGYRGYKWVSVVDTRTSEVCLTLNGLEFWVADAVNTLESMAATEDPEAATKLMPWRNSVETTGLSAPELRAAGYVVPPAHPHCRSTLVAV